MKHLFILLAKLLGLTYYRVVNNHNIELFVGQYWLIISLSPKSIFVAKYTRNAGQIYTLKKYWVWI